MTPTVTALLVSHDGARWLPAVLDGLAAQTAAPSRVVAVDTGSTDGSRQLLADRLPTVVDLPERTPYGVAVAAGLATLPAGRDEHEWVWLLHDDSRPDPGALAALLDAAAADPTADVLGPKIREWPSLRRLLEVGVTLSGTGRRETGLERGEYDQGQHDEVRDVLAVNTAGMLVRRSVLERLGLDPVLPVLGTDLDFGWRAARAGHRTVVVPTAVVFHVEAAHRGVRRTLLTGRHPRRAERAAALFVLLANAPAWRVGFSAVRLLLGSLLRALGLLLVRAPRESLDELLAAASVLGRPWRLLRARRRRRRAAVRGHRDIRHLLAPFWLPYRHGLDFVTDVLSAVVASAGDATASRRARVEAAETGPVPVEAQSLPEDTGLVARSVRSPVAWAALGLVVAALVAGRGLYGAGLLAGGALLPAPGGATDWWRLYLASAHDVGTGSSAPAAPFVLVLAVLGTALAGKAWLVVDLLLLLAVPLATFGAVRLLRRLSGSRTASLWGGVAYGLLPILGGAVQQGRLGTVAAAVVLPWLVQTALALGSPDADRRTRAGWRAGLWLAVLAAFAPLALPVAAVLTAAGLGLVLTTDPRRRGRAWWLPAVLPVPVASTLLLPWTVSVWAHHGPQAWLMEAGLPVAELTEPLSRADLLLFRPGPEGAPWWVLVALPVVAGGALLRPDTRRRVLACSAVAVAGLLTAAVLSGVAVTPTTATAAGPVWLGLPLLLAGGAAVAAAVVAGAGVRDRLAGRSFGWRQPVGAGLVVTALAAPVAGLLWWVVTGSGDPLERRPGSAVPAYMTDAVADGSGGILVVRGGGRDGFEHLLVRGPGLRLGADTVLPPATAQAPLTGLVRDLVTGPEPADAGRLAALGVGFVLAPAPVDDRLAANLDALSGLTTASAGAARARAWQVQPPGPAPERSAATPEGDPWRPWLLAGQAVAVLVTAVAAAPSREVRR